MKHENSQRNEQNEERNGCRGLFLLLCPRPNYNAVGIDAGSVAKEKGQIK